MRHLEIAGLRTSAIGLGTWQFGSREWGYGEAYATQTAPGLVRRAVELGISMLDTAEAYGPGRSERIIAGALAGIPPADRAGAVFEDASSRYGALAGDLQELHSDVVRLSKKLQAINGLTAVNGAGLGGVVLRGGGGTLPSVSKSAPKSGGGSKPPANGTTGASGAPP